MPTAPFRAELSRVMTEPCPCCDHCRHAVRCSAEQLACDAFAAFLLGQNAERCRIATRVPTRARFEVIFGRRG
jgi:hypothetical protein